MRTRNSRMRKPVRQNGIVAGVCGGLDAYFGVSPWLFRILFHVISHQRRKWFGRLIFSEREDLEQTTVYTPPVPEELTDDEVLAALRKIPRQFAEVVMLCDAQEFSYKEIQETLGIPIGSQTYPVRARIAQEALHNVARHSKARHAAEVLGAHEVGKARQASLLHHVLFISVFIFIP